jgi:LPS export ABC transporter protein LptC
MQNLPHKANVNTHQVLWGAVGLLVIALFAIKYFNAEPADVSATPTTKGYPQIFITNVKVRQYDSEGNLHYQLNTPLIRQFQINESASNLDYGLFDTPVFMLINDPEKPGWLITAQEGRRDNNGLWISLSTDVVARQTSEKQGDITIATTDLRLNTQEQFAETSKAVTIDTEKSHMSATGLHADLKRDHIELLSHVKGTYEP